MAALAEGAGARAAAYEEEREGQPAEEAARQELPVEAVFLKGQSRRIWGELYKVNACVQEESSLHMLWQVLDSSDVVVQVLDARDPQGTRSSVVERHLRDKCKGKHLVFVLNKCDLVPTWATARWIAALGKVAPTLAFHAHLTRPFGKV
jgi:nuclear GTP-binding protein